MYNGYTCRLYVVYQLLGKHAGKVLMAYRSTTSFCYRYDRLYEYRYLRRCSLVAHIIRVVVSEDGCVCCE